MNNLLSMFWIRQCSLFPCGSESLRKHLYTESEDLINETLRSVSRKCDCTTHIYGQSIPLTIGYTMLQTDTWHC